MRLIFTIFVSLIAAAASAHDFWLEPSTFRPPPGSNVTVRLRVGEHFRGDAVARNARLVERFIARNGANEMEIAGNHGDDPAGTLVIQRAGVWVLGYRSKPRPVTLEAAKFEQYLREEGLEHVIETRRKQRRANEPGREIFSRSAKSFLVAGSDRAGVSKPLGFRFELVPDALDARFRTTVLFEGKPAAGVLVVAMNKDGARLTARTSADGRATLPLTRGHWLVKAVHMVPAPDESGADWESLWASVTFEL
jgi:uncharacterized GH25 family protein